MHPGRCTAGLAAGGRLCLNSGKAGSGRHEYPFESHFLNVHGVRLHYVDEGAGDPVLMLHGQPTWSYLWRKIIPSIAASRRAIAPDLMGFGLSDKPPDRDYTFVEHAGMLERLIETLGLKDLTLVLHDWGGPIGLQYAVRHPENMKALVLVSTFAGTGFRAPWWFRLPTRTPLLSDLLVRRFNLFGRYAIRFGSLSRVPAEVLREYRERHPDYASRKGVAAFPKMLPLSSGDEAWRPMAETRRRLTGLKTPTLFIAGDRDPVTRWLGLDWILEAMPHARVEIVEKAGHYIQEDRPDELTRLILEFLDGSLDEPGSAILALQTRSDAETRGVTHGL